MRASAKSVMRSIARAVAWIFYIAAGLSFWAGGRAIHEFDGTNRVLAEGGGILIAVVCLVLGGIVSWLAEK